MLNRSINLYLLPFIVMLFLAPSVDAAGTKTITRGQSAVINWNVTGAPSCSPDTTYPNGAGDNVYALWSGAGNNTSGSITFPNVYNVNTSGWTFSCRDAASGISDSATLIVNDCTSPQVWSGTACVAPATPAPTADITQDTTSTVQGTSFYINWSSTNASSCTVTYSGPLSGTLSTGPTSGGPTEMNPGTTGTYIATNTCTNSAGTTATKNISHEVLAPSSCALPWGGSIASGQSVTAYQSATVVSPATCQSQTRTCTNGTLSGTYTNQTCSVTSSSQPDLIIDSISPASGTEGDAVTLTAAVRNAGGAATNSGGMMTLFQKATSAAGANAMDIGTHTRITDLGAGLTYNAITTYTLPAAGTIYIRACADKDSASSAGIVSESNENNNCGAWTPLTINASGPSFIDIFFN